MQAFLAAHNLISTLQYGFQKQSFTIIQLIDCLSNWFTSPNGGKATDAIFLDYSKVFDRVFHSKLLLKLCAYSIHNDSWRWFENFLSNRTQAVMINDSF